MVKRLIQGLLLGLLAVHINAQALGLGEIQLNSALNQPLLAEIRLLSATAEDADSIDVSLASYETFSKVGIDRPSILALLRFNVAAKGNGYVIKIDSHDPIREPFLDFILEVTWSSGRVLREYTLLLDPPEFKRAQPAQIQAPVTQSQQRVEAPTTPREVATAQQRTVAKGSRLAGTISPTDKGGIKYGPVRNGETLWSIAKEMRSGSSVSTQQMLMALLEENPNSFIAGDINRLKRGSILRLNNPDIIGSISHQEAMTEIAQRTQPSAMRRPADVDGEMIGSDSAVAKRPSLKLVTPDLKTTSDRMGATVAEGGDGEAMRQELMLALEISEAQRRENEALKERMSDLQRQLDSLKRLITLKDGDLAQMQQQLAQPNDASEAAPTEIAPTETAPTETAPAETASVDVVEEPTEPAEAVESESPALVIPDLPESEETIADALKQDDTASVQDLAVTEPEVTEPEVAQKAAPKPKAVPIPSPIVNPIAEPDFISKVLADPMLMATGGGALILVLLLILLIMKRRGNRFHESILSGDASSMGVSATGGPDTSFLSDLAISGLAGGSMETDEGEVDPVTEADVYMAYGRFQQAESLLKDALESDPERIELKSKLLEVYYTAKDKEQFDAIIAESSEQLQEDESSWKNILVMGHELSPENSLFAEAPEVEATEGDEFLSTGEGEESAIDDVLDIGIDLDELSAEMESAEGELDIDLGLDFSDLDDDLFSSTEDGEESSESSHDDEISGEVEESAAKDDESFELDSFDISDLNDDEPEDDGTIDFNIDDIDMDSLHIGGKDDSTVADAPIEAPEEIAEEIEGAGESESSEVDFSLDDLDDLDSAETTSLSAELDDALASMDDDLHDIGDLGDLSADSSEIEAFSEDAADSELDDLADLDLDFESMGNESSEEASEGVSGSEIDDLGDLDFDFELTESESSEDTDGKPVSENELDISDDFNLELGDLDFDMIDDDSPDDAAADTLDIDDSEPDETEGDMDTKIDLAKAYIEMGDADGARNMLNEVISQGDDNQKQQAQDLLDSI